MVRGGEDFRGRKVRLCKLPCYERVQSSRLEFQDNLKAVGGKRHETLRPSRRQYWIFDGFDDEFNGFEKSSGVVVKLLKRKFRRGLCRQYLLAFRPLWQAA